MKTSHTLLLLASLSTSLTLHAAPNERALEVSKYWTAERMAAAWWLPFSLHGSIHGGPSTCCRGDITLPL